jgi:hypothetical protein
MQFPGYRFEPKIAYILQDLVKSKDTNTLDHIGNALRAGIVYFPLKHDANMLTGYVVDRGAAKVVNPLAYRRAVKSLAQAYIDVTNMSGRVPALLGKGMNMMSYPDSAMSDAFTKSVKQLSPEDPVIHDIASKFGVKAIHVYTALQHTSVWQAQDILNVARVYENMMPTLTNKTGMSLDEALAKTERYNLRYHLPAQIGPKFLGNTLRRDASKLMGSNMLFFGRYTYDKYRIVTNMLKDTINPKTLISHPGENYQAASKLAALALVTAAWGAAVNKGVQTIYGDPSAYITTPGVGDVVDRGYKVLTGQKNALQEVFGQLYISSAYSAGMDILSNRDSFTGKLLYDPNASLATNIKQIVDWLNGQSPVSQQFKQLSNVKKNKAISIFLALASTRFPKDSPQKAKLMSLKYDSLPFYTAQEKADIKAGNLAGAARERAQYNKLVQQAYKLSNK